MLLDEPFLHPYHLLHLIYLLLIQIMRIFPLFIPISISVDVLALFRLLQGSFHKNMLQHSLKQIFVFFVMHTLDSKLFAQPVYLIYCCFLCLLNALYYQLQESLHFQDLLYVVLISTVFVLWLICGIQTGLLLRWLIEVILACQQPNSFNFIDP